MLKRLALFLIIFLLCAPSGLASPVIRVAIVNAQRSALIVPRGGSFNVRLNSGDSLVLTPDTQYLITAADNSLHVDGRRLDGKTLRLAPVSAESLAEINKRVFRGALQIHLAESGQALNVINHLPLEEYLHSAVANETPPLWPPEAVKAQAVICRTIALRAKTINAGQLFDIGAMDGNTYYGVKTERAEVTELIRATAGQAVLWRGTPARLFFHVSGGGHTDGLAQYPYLRPVVDYDQDCPNFEWKKIYTAKEVDERLQYAGFGGIGKLQGFELSPLSGAQPDRKPSGRLLSVKVLGDRGLTVLTGEQFAALLSLPSSAFDIAAANLLPESVDVPITDPFGNVIGIKKIPLAINTEPSFPADRPLALRVTWADNEKIIIKGRGEGSGLGYSQWGGRSMALATSDYRTIIQHYFTGAQIQKMY